MSNIMFSEEFVCLNLEAVNVAHFVQANLQCKRKTGSNRQAMFYKTGDVA